jgi:acyl-CoA hydrolase
MKSKTPSQSQVETRYLVLPKDTNAHGTVFGGTILSWVDMAACMAAERHAGMEVVTAAIDSVSFHTPITLDDHVVLLARVNYVRRTSMEVEVEVVREHPHTGVVIKATSAYVTVVAVDDEHKPVGVCGLEPKTEDEKQRYAEAEERVKSRIAQRKS